METVMRRNEKSIGRNSFRPALLLGIFLTFFGLTSILQAQPSESWASRMFSAMGTEKAFNFGNLALHAEAEHRFAFKNIYKEDVEIISAQSNCSCTNVTVSKRVIKSQEVGEIIARVDTSGKIHTGRRKVTVTVRFGKPQPAEIQLQVQSFIRADVVFNPGNVEFGTVSQGHGSQKKVLLEYHGSNPNWRLSQIKKTTPAIAAVAQPISGGYGGKAYEVTVTLNETAEPGYINGKIQFIANDGDGQSVFVPVHALVMAPLMATPTHLQIGVVHPGESVSKNLVLRGSVPFKIEKISSSDSRVSFLTADLESKLHIIPVTFRAGENQSGEEINQQIHIVTSKKDLDPIDIPLTGYISEEEVLPRYNELADGEQLLRAYTAAAVPRQIALGLLSAPLSGSAAPTAGRAAAQSQAASATAPKSSVIHQNNPAGDSDAHYTVSRLPMSVATQIATHISAQSINKETYTASTGGRSASKKNAPRVSHQVSRPVTEQPAPNKPAEELLADSRAEEDKPAENESADTQAAETQVTDIHVVEAKSVPADTEEDTAFDEDGWTAAADDTAAQDEQTRPSLGNETIKKDTYPLSQFHSAEAPDENIPDSASAKALFRRPEQVAQSVSAPRSSNAAGNDAGSAQGTTILTVPGSAAAPTAEAPAGSAPQAKSVRSVKRTARRNAPVDPTSEDGFYILDFPQ